MGNTELKKLLIHRISEIEDTEFLNAIKTIIEARTANPTLLLTPDILRIIAASKKEYEEGLIYEQSEVDGNFNQWVKKGVN